MQLVPFGISCSIETMNKKQEWYARTTGGDSFNKVGRKSGRDASTISRAAAKGWKLSAETVIAIALEGVEAVPLVRKIVGPTEPKSAEMGTIRGDYSHMSFGYSTAKGIGVPNLVHASGSVAEAKRELALWFEEDELYDYSDLNEKYTR